MNNKLHVSLRFFGEYWRKTARSFDEEVHGWIELFSFCYHKRITRLDESFVETLEQYAWEIGRWSLPDILKWSVLSSKGSVLSLDALPYTFVSELDEQQAQARKATLERGPVETKWLK